MRHSWTLLGALLFGLNLSAFGQQTNAIDQQTRQQAEAIVARIADTLSKGDGQGYRALYASNAVEISAFGKSTGQQIGDLEDVHKMGLTFTAKVDDVEPLFGGEGAVIVAPYTATFTNNPATRQAQGISVLVLERQGSEWKIRVATFSRLAAAASPR